MTRAEGGGRSRSRAAPARRESRIPPPAVWRRRRPRRASGRRQDRPTRAHGGRPRGARSGRSAPPAHVRLLGRPSDLLRLSATESWRASCSRRPTRSPPTPPGRDHGGEGMVAFQAAPTGFQRRVMQSAFAALLDDLVAEEAALEAVVAAAGGLGRGIWVTPAAGWAVRARDRPSGNGRRACRAGATDRAVRIETSWTLRPDPTRRRRRRTRPPSRHRPWNRRRRGGYSAALQAVLRTLDGSERVLWITGDMACGCSRTSPASWRRGRRPGRRRRPRRRAGADGAPRHIADLGVRTWSFLVRRPRPRRARRRDAVRVVADRRSGGVGRRGRVRSGEPALPSTSASSSPSDVTSTTLLSLSGTVPGSGRRLPKPSPAPRRLHKGAPDYVEGGVTRRCCWTSTITAWPMWTFNRPKRLRV